MCSVLSPAMRDRMTNTKIATRRYATETGRNQSVSNTMKIRLERRVRAYAAVRWYCRSGRVKRVVGPELLTAGLVQMRNLSETWRYKYPCFFTYHEPESEQHVIISKRWIGIWHFGSADESWLWAYAVSTSGSKEGYEEVVEALESSKLGWVLWSLLGSEVNVRSRQTWIAEMMEAILKDCNDPKRMTCIR